MRWNDARRRLAGVVAVATAMGVAPLLPSAMATSDQARATVADLDSDAQVDQFIIGLREDSSLSALSADERADRVLELTAATGVQSRQMRVTGLGSSVVSTPTMNADEAAQYMKTIAAQPDVAYIHPDITLSLLENEEPAEVTKSLPLRAAAPNDTDWSKQWDMRGEGGGMKADGAWDISRGEGAVVAVVDNGIRKHRDLANNLLPGYDFVSTADAGNDGDGRDGDPTDPGDGSKEGECGPGSKARTSTWHGTHVAGTVAAEMNNNHGIAGVAPKAKVVPVRVLGKCGGKMSDVTDGMLWAAGISVPGAPDNRNPVSAMNVSLGGKQKCAAEFQSAINKIVARNSTVVIAAGNSKLDVSEFTPANCDNIVAVASLGPKGGRAPYSNFGAKIDVAAPGGDTKDPDSSGGIYSTVDVGKLKPEGDGFASYQGTSMAAPHVTGLVALMASKKKMSPSEVEQTLKQNVRPLPGPCPEGCGAGLIDATKTMQAVSGTCPPGNDPAPGPGPTAQPTAPPNPTPTSNPWPTQPPRPTRPPRPTNPGWPGLPPGWPGRPKQPAADLGVSLTGEQLPGVGRPVAV